MANTALHSMTQQTTPPARADETYLVISPFGGTDDRRTTVGNFLDRLIYWSDTAPGSPAADDLWWETDTNILWTYGTYASASRWVSVNVNTSMGVVGAASAATAGGINMTLGGGLVAGYNIYIATMYFKHYVTSANSGNTGSHYWSATLRKVATTVAPASAAGTSLGTCNTSASTVGTWTEVTASIDAVIDGTGAGIEIPFLETAETGTPGDLWYNIGVTYRLVHP